MIPQTYDEWRHCIIVECRIPLTAAFVAERLNVWRDTQLDETSRFRRLYGDEHWKAVLGWFEQAARGLGPRTESA
ncbi:MAG: hypothetical protein AB7O55_15925 [Lautropia sp.]